MSVLAYTSIFRNETCRNLLFAKLQCNHAVFSKKEDNFRYISPVIVSIFTIQMKPYM